MTYPKPWRSYEEQLDLLTARGMVVTDRERAIDCLERIGYYRLSGYWFAFRERADADVLDRFKRGATFQNAVDLYVFDKKLRLLVLDALERIEVALRVDISHMLGRLEPFAYQNPQLFHDSFSVKIGKGARTRHREWLDKHDQLISRSREEFVRHNRLKYGLPLAIWVACEVWDFGTMSMLFSGMREAEQDLVARKYGVGNGRTFASWLRSLNYLRNVCAHHSRLWNRNVVDQPKLPPVAEAAWVAPFKGDTHAQARCFLLLAIARHLLQVVNPRSGWSDRMREHLQGFPDLAHLGLSLQGMGAPENWMDLWCGSWQKCRA